MTNKAHREQKRDRLDAKWSQQIPVGITWNMFSLILWYITLEIYQLSYPFFAFSADFLLSSLIMVSGKTFFTHVAPFVSSLIYIIIA